MVCTKDFVSARCFVIVQYSRIIVSCFLCMSEIALCIVELNYSISLLVSGFNQLQRQMNQSGRYSVIKCISGNAFIVTQQSSVLIFLLFRKFIAGEMTMSMAKHIVVFVVVTLLMKKATPYIICPSQCQCSNFTVKCVGQGLRAIPHGIPTTARSIDISNNPQIKIKPDYFLQFKDLFVLSLSNSGQRGPIHLPSTIRQVRLDNNFFTIDSLKEMFSNKVQALKRISLANNNLQSSGTKTLLKILPAGLMLLNINNNKLNTLASEDMLRYNDIKLLDIGYCSLKSIQANALDNMRNLSTLYAYRNNLRYLPDGLFKFNTRLFALDLSHNELPGFNATKLGIRGLHNICLAEHISRHQGGEPGSFQQQQTIFIAREPFQRDDDPYCVSPKQQVIYT